MTTALITHTDCLKHLTPAGHPERVDRLKALLELFDEPSFKHLPRHEAPLCTIEQIERAHRPGYYNQIAQSEPQSGFTTVDGDTHMSPHSLQAARRAAGANVLAVDLVLTGQSNNAFCAVRPPGHHAEAARAMGFCLFSNVMIGAHHALGRHQLERVAIVDFDVHHGNGTSDLAWHDDRIFFASTHESPLFPGTGLAHEVGAHGQIVNVPLKSQTGNEEFKRAMETQILPALANHRPQCIFISAGFDAHWRDPLATLRWTDDIYGWATEAICDVADRCCDGRVISSLEGGYDLDGLRDSVAVHLQALMQRSR